jgi:predicted metal-dependent phosphoesterase TrpH
MTSPSKVDFHCHSTFSDGSLPPADLARRMAEAGVQVFALTDHDTVRGIPHAIDAARALGIRCLPGVEVSCRWSSQDIHVVGLGIDPRHSGLATLLEQQSCRRWSRARRMGERLEKACGPGVFDRACALAAATGLEGSHQASDDGSPCPGRPHFARALVSMGHCKDDNHAFRKFLAQGKPAYVATEWPTLPEAASAIRLSGGVPVLAHPLHYRLTRSKLERLVSDFAAAGGLAMEVSGVNQDPLQRRMLGHLCEKYCLHGSVASDYHGTAMPWIRLGDLPPLPAGVRPVTELLELSA